MSKKTQENVLPREEIIDQLKDLTSELNQCQKIRIKIENSIFGQCMRFYTMMHGLQEGKARAASEKAKMAIIKGDADGDENLELLAKRNQPALDAMQPFLKREAILNKQIEDLAKQLPEYEFAQSVPGLGAKLFGKLIGESGDLKRFETVAKFWAYMGIGIKNGKIQQNIKGAEAIEMAYCSRRRSLVWNIGASIIKQQSERVDKETGEVLRDALPYRAYYDYEKERQLRKFEESPHVIKSSKTGKEVKSGKGHAHNRAKRHMEKLLLRDLWNYWNGHEPVMKNEWEKGEVPAFLAA